MPRSTTAGTAFASGTALCEWHEPWLELGAAAFFSFVPPPACRCPTCQHLLCALGMSPTRT